MPLLMCPNDNAPMQTVERAGVQFDMCPACRGVWLDRGELEKLMQSGAAAAAPPPRHQGREDGSDRRGDDRDGRDRYRRKTPSIFDIFD